MKHIENFKLYALQKILPKMKVKISSLHEWGRWCFFFWKEIPFANNCGAEGYSLGIGIWQTLAPARCVNDSVPSPHSWTNAMCVSVGLSAARTHITYQRRLNSFHISSRSSRIPPCQWDTGISQMYSIITCLFAWSRIYMGSWFF